MANAACKQTKITQRMSRKGNCWDNAVIGYLTPAQKMAELKKVA
jgi:transposase InsO family protein